MIAVKAISDLSFSVSQPDDQFIQFLADQGSNRYVGKIAYSSLDALERLDSVVWHIRRYCQSFEPSAVIPVHLQAQAKLEILQRALNPKFEKTPHLFALSAGEIGKLERVLKKPHNDPARRALVWANFFYGAKKRKPIHYRAFSGIEVPPKERGWINVDPNTWPTVDQYVKP